MPTTASPIQQFSSAKAFFEAASNVGAEIGGLYVVNGRPVRFSVGADTEMRGCLERLDWKDLSRLGRFMATLGSLFFGLDLGAFERTGKSKTPFQNDRMVASDVIIGAANPAALTEKIVRELEAAKLLVRAGYVSRQYASEWHDLLRHAVFKACRGGPVQVDRELSDLNKLILKSTPDIVPTSRSTNAAVPANAQHELLIDLDMRATQDNEVLNENSAATKFNEVAIGGFHGDSKVLLHALLQLKFFELVKDADVKSDGRPREKTYYEQCLQDALTHLERETIDHAEFASMIGAALQYKDVNASRRALILVGGLCTQAAMVSLTTLSLLELMHDRGMPFEITYAHSDRDLIARFLHLRMRQRHIIQQKSTRSIGPKHCELTQEETEFVRLMHKAYVPHLKLATMSGSGRTLYTDLVQHDMLDAIQRRCGFQKNAPVTAKSCKQVNRYLQDAIRTMDGEKFLAMTAGDNWTESIHSLGDAASPLAPSTAAFSPLPALSLLDKPRGGAIVVQGPRQDPTETVALARAEFNFLRGLRKTIATTLAGTHSDAATRDAICRAILHDVSLPGLSPGSPVGKLATTVTAITLATRNTKTHLHGMRPEGMTQLLSAQLKLMPEDAARSVAGNIDLLVKQVEGFRALFIRKQRNATASVPQPTMTNEAILLRHATAIKALDEKHGRDVAGARNTYATERRKLETVHADAIQEHHAGLKAQAEAEARHDQALASWDAESAELQASRDQCRPSRPEGVESVDAEYDTALTSWKEESGRAQEARSRARAELVTQHDISRAAGRAKAGPDEAKLNADLDIAYQRLSFGHDRELQMLIRAYGEQVEWLTDDKSRELAAIERMATALSEQAVDLDTALLREMERATALALNEVRKSLGDYALNAMTQGLTPKVVGTAIASGAQGSDRHRSLDDKEIDKALSDLEQHYKRSVVSLSPPAKNARNQSGRQIGLTARTS